MTRKLLFAAAALVALASSAAPALAQGLSNRITLYAGAGRTGDARSFTDVQSNLGNAGFNDKAASVRIDGGGAWQVCDGANFTGHCETLTGNVDDLARVGLARQISSIRPAQQAAGGQDDRGYANRGGPEGGPYDRGDDHDDRDYRPGDPVAPPIAPQPNFRQGGWDRPDAVGHNSAYFINPRLNGRPVIVDSYRGGRRAAELAADTFCRQVGYREGAYYTLDQQRWGAGLQDVLCIR